MKKIKLGLLPQILIAIALGIAAGTVSPELPVRVFVTFNALFSQFLNFIIPLIIVGLVTPAIADIGIAPAPRVAISIRPNRALT